MHRDKTLSEGVLAPPTYIEAVPRGSALTGD